MNKRNKKAIVITAVVMFIGILLVLAGFFGNWFTGLFKKGFDYKNIKSEDLGQNIETDIFVYYDDIDLKDKKLQVVGDINGDFAFILFDLSGMSEKDKQLYFRNMYKHITVQGRLRAVDDAEFKEVAESLYRLYDPMFYQRERFKENGERVTLEEFRKVMTDPVIHYCIDVKTVGTFNWFPFIPAGAVLFLISFVLEICFVFKLKKKIVLPVVYGLMILIPSVLLFNHIRTMMTVHKVSDGLYTMKNLECTNTKGMMDSGAKSVDELLGWILNRHLYGAPNLFDKNNFGFGCAAFAAVTADGDHLLGRNFDYTETDTILVHSHPEGAYESIGIADLGVLGVGQEASVNPDSPLGRLIMIITPYMVVDGMNEKGVGAGILQISIDETHQDNGKPDLLIYCAIRAILDNCASVDEALKLLDTYDIHSDLETTYHLFITDRSGRYVVVEWLDGKMVTVEHPCCTNSVIAPGKYYGKGETDGRLSTIEKELGSKREVTEQEAMAILEKVKNKQLTEWSCVYNLDELTVSICLDNDFSKVYTFKMKDLG